MQNVATTNETIVIDRDISIGIPEGYVYSTDKSEINYNRSLVVMKTQTNKYFIETNSESAEWSFDSPYSAPQCMVVSSPREFDMCGADFSNAEIRGSMRSISEQLWEHMYGRKSIAVIERDDILVYYAAFEKDESNTSFQICTTRKIYNGQIWLNDESDKSEKIRQVTKWLSTVKKHEITDADKIPRTPFVMPTYNEGKRAQMGLLSVRIPDNMISFEEMVSENGERLATAFDDAQFRERYALLAVTKGHQGGFFDLDNAPLLIRCENKDARALPGLETVWENDAKTIEEELIDVVKRNQEAQNQNVEGIKYKRLGDNFAVVYSQISESEDPIEQWCAYMVYFFYKGDLVAPNIVFNSIKDKESFASFVDAWVSSVEIASEEAIIEYKKQNNTRALGAYAAGDGKLDAVKGTQLFFDDLFFFVEGQMTAEGLHHKVITVETNSEATDQFPDVMKNHRLFAESVVDMINFVDRDENLVLGEKCVHHAFDALNDNLGQPIINGQPVHIKDACIGRGLSGARVFLLIAWHMIKIVETEKDNYLVVLDQNIYIGIPDATAYVAQFIKRLREYNGIEGGFEVQFASAFNMTGGMDGAIEGKNPLACEHQAISGVTVADGKDPYAHVIDKIAECESDDIWNAWNRGRNGDIYTFDGFEGELLQIFIEEDTMIPLSDIQARFPHKTKSEVKAALDGLCEKGVMLGGDNFINCLYGLEIPAESIEIVSDSGKKTKANKLDAPKVSKTEINSSFQSRSFQSNDEEIKKILDQIKKEYKSAEASMERKKAEVERNAAVSIDIYVDDAIERAMDIVRETVRTAGEFHEKCQELVLELDSRCRELVTDATSANLVGEIADMIKDLNESSDININFNGTFEGEDLGDIGNGTFEASSEAKRIERTWTIKAQTFEQKAIEKENEIYAAKYGIAVSDIAKHKEYEAAKALFVTAENKNDYEKAKAAFDKISGYKDAADYASRCEAKLNELVEAEKAREKEKKRTEAARSNEKKHQYEEQRTKYEDEHENAKKKLSSFKSELKARKKTLESELETFINEKSSALNAEIAEHTAILGSLGFFKFSEKKAEKRAIRRLRFVLGKLTSPSVSEEIKADWDKKIDEAAKRYKDASDSFFKQKYPVLVLKKSNNSFGFEKKKYLCVEGRDEKSKEMNRILDYISKSKKAILPSDLMERFDFSGVTVRFRLNKLKDIGFVQETVINGMSYYSIDDENKQIAESYDFAPKHQRELMCLLHLTREEKKLPDESKVSKTLKNSWYDVSMSSKEIQLLILYLESEGMLMSGSLTAKGNKQLDNYPEYAYLFSYAPDPKYADSVVLGPPSIETVLQLDTNEIMSDIESGYNE